MKWWDINMMNIVEKIQLIKNEYLNMKNDVLSKMNIEWLYI